MIILFDENEKDFSSLGLGILRDATSCQVKEGLNDAFELEMKYPIDGNNFSKIEINKIIYCKPNPYDSMQPFRIASISKPIDGIVTIDAYHISYDMNGIGLNPIYGINLRDTLEKIQNGSIIPSNFKFYTDTNSSKTYKTTAPYNMRAVLMGSDDSILEKYECEVKFNKFEVHLLAKRGSNRGAQVRYAKNLTDLKHDILNDNLYNGVYPYYHKETTNVNSETSTGDFKQAYIVGKKPYQDGWLSYTNGGEPYHPVDTAPIQIATEGDYYQNVYTWNPTIQRYEEKIYNQSVTLVEGVISPDWIYIDWTKLPNIVCKAGVNGYFKASTETEWTYHNEGDVIFEGNIKQITTDIAGKFIMYYAEVIPTESSSSSEEESSVSHVELKDKIMWLDTPEAKAMTHNKILMLDLTSEFDNEDIPDEDKLKAKANEYIEKNKIGKYKFDTDVSFIDLSSTANGDTYKDLEKVELGDTVKIVYKQLNIDIDLRVISTEYDVLSERYIKVELGEKSDKLSGNSIQTGDDVSSLTNDVGYTDVSTVNKLIAKIVTADYIQAKNAKLSTAQILELQTARIKCTGILEATQLELDTLVAKMLTADNAAISNELKAGTVTVAGDITINSGAISITNGEKVFSVTRDGDLTANSVTITGGSLNIADSFEVTNEGILTARGADIQGDIQATGGLIGGFTIGENAIYNTIASFDDESDTGVYLGTDGIKLGSKFIVDSTGKMIAEEAELTGKITATSGNIGGAVIENGILKIGSANVIDINVNDKFIVDANGNTTIQNGSRDAYIKLLESGAIRLSNVSVKGSIIARSGDIGGFCIEDSTMYNGSIKSWDTDYTTETGIYFDFNGIRIGPNYRISKDGSSFIGKDKSDISTGVDADGKLTALNAEILGKITAESGYIGTEKEGFSINKDSIYKKFGDKSNNKISDVVYIGTDKIRLGQDITYSFSINIGEIIKANTKLFNLPYGKNGEDSLSGENFIFSTDPYNEDRPFKIIYCDKDGDQVQKFNGTFGDTVVTDGISNHIVKANASTLNITLGYTYIENYKADSNGNIIYYKVNEDGLYAIDENGDYIEDPNGKPMKDKNGVPTEVPIYGIKFIAADRYKADSNGNIIYYKVNEDGLYAIDENGDYIEDPNGKPMKLIIIPFANCVLSLPETKGFLVKNNGLLIANNAQITGSFKGDVNIDGGSIKIQNGNTTTFEVTSDGELTATIGRIAEFNIDSNGFHKWTSDIGENNSVLISHGYSSNISIGGSTGTNVWALTAGKNFGVTTSGLLIANNAQITGDLTAKSGMIGPLHIDLNNTIYYLTETGNKSFIINPTTTYSYWQYVGNNENLIVDGIHVSSALTFRYIDIHYSDAPSLYKVFFTPEGLLTSSGLSGTNSYWDGNIPLKYFSNIPFFNNSVRTYFSDNTDDYELSNDKVHNPIFDVTTVKVSSGRLGTTVSKPTTRGITYNKLIYANAIPSLANGPALITSVSSNSTDCIIRSTVEQDVILFRIFI